MTPPGDTEICTRAEALLDQAFNTADDAIRDTLFRQAHQLLAPLVAVGFPEALYLHACCTLFLEGLDEQAHDERYIALIQQAAHGGDERAQFRMGQMHEPESEL